MTGGSASVACVWVLIVGHYHSTILPFNHFSPTVPKFQAAPHPSLSPLRFQAEAIKAERDALQQELHTLRQESELLRRIETLEADQELRDKQLEKEQVRQRQGGAWGLRCCVGARGCRPP